MSFLGAILPAWGYHLRPSFTEVGDYFLILALGLLLSVGAAHFLLPRRGLKFVLVLASLLACGGFLFLAVSSPPAPAAWRIWGVLCIGFSTGLLNAGVFHAISPIYQIDPRRYRQFRRSLVRIRQPAHRAAGGRNILRLHGSEHSGSVCRAPGPLRSGLLQRELLAAPDFFNAPARPGTARFSESWSACCSACCYSFNSAMNGRWRDGCRCS